MVRLAVTSLYIDERERERVHSDEKHGSVLDFDRVNSIREAKKTPAQRSRKEGTV